MAQVANPHGNVVTGGLCQCVLSALSPAKQVKAGRSAIAWEKEWVWQRDEAHRERPSTHGAVEGGHGEIRHLGRLAAAHFPVSNID